MYEILYFTDPLGEPKELRLLRAILTRAIGDYLNFSQIGGRVSQADQITARSWIFSNSNREFGFVWVCQHIGYEPNKTRADIVKLSKLPFRERMENILKNIEESPSKYALKRFLD